MSSLARMTLMMTLLSGIAAPAKAAQYKIRWMIGHPVSDYFEQAAESFKSAVEKGSGGDISVSIQLAENAWEDTGGAVKPEIAEKVSRGEAEMGHSFTSVIGRLDPAFQVFDAPYLFTGYKHLEGVFDSPLGAEMLDGLSKHGMIGLSFTYSGGAQSVSSAGKDLRSPADFKGLRVAVFGSDVEKAWLKALGAEAVPIGHQLDKLAPMTARGEIDAALVTWRRMTEARLAPRHRFVGMPRATYLASVTYINKSYFEKLPKRYQDLVRGAALTAGRIERARTIELNALSMQEQLAKGVVAAELSAAALAGYKAAVAPAGPEIERIVGRRLLERVRGTPESAEHPWGIEMAAGRPGDAGAIRVAGQ